MRTLALSLCFVAASAVWLRLDQSPPAWDDAWYLTNSLVMFDALSDGGLPGYATSFFTTQRIKPPLITVLPTPAYLVLGRRWHAAFAVNLVSMLVLFFVLHAIARRFRGESAGWIAVFVAGTMPLLYGLSRWFLIECSLTALVCVTLYLVIRALAAPSGSNLFWLGTACGLGSLLKTTFPVYVLGALVYLMVRRVRASWIWFLAPAVLLPLPWWAVNYRHAVQQAVVSGFSNEGAFYGTGPVFAASSIGRYLLKVVNEGASAYYVLLAAALLLLLGVTGKLGAWWRAWPKDCRIVLLLWSLPFLVFLFGRGKDVKWIAPILPVMVLVTASLLDEALRWAGRWRFAAGALALAFPLLAFLHTSFGVLGNLRLASGGVVFTARELGYARAYETQGWPLPEILDRIMQTGSFRGGARKTVMIGTDRAGFNSNNFELAVLRARLPLQIVTSAHENELPAALAALRAASFFVYKEGGEPEAAFYNRLQRPLLDEVREGGGFREIPCGLRLPDGGVARIYENLARADHLQSGALVRAGAYRVRPYVFDFGGLLQLAGFAFERSPQSLALRLRWRCLRQPDREYVCFVHILDRAGHLVGQLDHRLLGGNPLVVTWRPGDEALESLAFPLAAGSRADSYHLRMGLYHVPTGDRLKATIVSGGAGFALADGETAVLTPEATTP